VRAVAIGAPSALDEVRVVGAAGVEYVGKMTELRDCWESTSFALEKLQANPECVAQEQEGMKRRKVPVVHATIPSPKPMWSLSEHAHKVAIVREEGSNGDREMAQAFRLAGMRCWDVTMSDLAEGRASLSEFRGLAFVGGFSYADVLGSAKGWAATAKFHSRAAAELSAFYQRPDTFSLGVCNGCQLMHRLEWVPLGPGAAGDVHAPRLAHNKSGRFEARFVSLRVERSASVWLAGMEGSVLGAWSAHGEGQFEFGSEEQLAGLEKAGMVALRYADEDGLATETYPFNPNGSRRGVAGMCTRDGRHMALMPHPERSILKWQLPWTPASWPKDGPQAAPWLQMFINARLWADKH